MSLTTNAALNAMLELMQNASYAYKLYAAFITQDGTNDPVATVLYNNLGGDVTFQRQGSGYYTIDSEGLFTLGKTVVTNMFDDDNVIVNFSPQTVNFIDMYASQDTIISNKYLEIKVFN